MAAKATAKSVKKNNVQVAAKAAKSRKAKAAAKRAKNAKAAAKSVKNTKAQGGGEEREE